MCSEPGKTGKTGKLFFSLRGIRGCCQPLLHSSRCSVSINITRPTEDTLFPITSQVAAAISFFCLTEFEIFT